MPETTSFAGWKKGGLSNLYQETLERRKHKEIMTAATLPSDDLDPKFYYGDMPPIRDFSEGVSGFPPRLAVRVLRARRAELLASQAGSDMPTRDSEGTMADSDRLMAHRSFGIGKREGAYWVYQRGEKDRVLKVRFANGIVVDATMTYGDGCQPGEPETREGWRGLWEFVQAYGD